MGSIDQFDPLSSVYIFLLEDNGHTDSLQIREERSIAREYVRQGEKNCPEKNQ